MPSLAPVSRCTRRRGAGFSKRKASDSKEDRWRRFEVGEVRQREFKLDGFKWLKEESLEDGEDVPEPEGDSEPSAEAEALQSIGRQSMLELIERLSVEQQQVLTLKFVFNLPNADVATILDKTEGAVKSLQHRALVSLQKQVTSATEA